MRNRLPWEWEMLDNHNSASVTSRAKVYGGWIVHHSFVSPKGSMTESMVFVPDREHAWTIVKPKADPSIERSALANEFKTS